MASTSKPKPTCPECGGSDLYETVKPVPSGGGYAPDLLPGLHPWYRAARLRVVVCAGCGLHRQFASEEAQRMLRHSPKWRRM